MNRIIIMQDYNQTYIQNILIMGVDGQIKLSKEDKLVILIHSINQVHKLRSLSQEGQCVYPKDWQVKKNGSYVIIYGHSRHFTHLQFKATPKENKLDLSFKLIGSKTSYRVQFDLDDILEQHANNYVPTFKECLKESEELSKTTEKSKAYQMTIPSSYQSNLASNNQEISNVGLANRIQGSNLPENIIPPRANVNLFANEQYVGPDSSLFQQPQSNPRISNPNSLRIPPGARYEPVDPFDNPFQNPVQHPQQFFGFDEFGRPISSPFGQGQRGDFPNRGGFGGLGGRGGFGRGGFGGGFGGGLGGGFGGSFGW